MFNAILNGLGGLAAGATKTLSNAATGAVSGVTKTLNGIKPGATQSATAGVFGPGGKNYLGGAGTALGKGASNEFGMGASLSAGANKSLQQLVGKMDNMSPEQSLMIAQQMAQFAAPPQFPPVATPQQAAPQFSNFMQPGGQSRITSQLRTPLGGRDA